jgi:three-Cys-motif partner protein
MLKLAISPIDKMLADLQDLIGGRNIFTWGQYLADKNRVAFEAQHPGTLFKLYSLYSYLIYPYLPIMQGWRNKSSARRLLYVDAFCGNGLNVLNIKKNKIYVCGSSILALLASHRLSRRRNFNFDEMILIDLKRRNIILLEKRFNDIVNALNISSSYSANLNLNDDRNVHIIQGDIKEPEFVTLLADYLERYWLKFPLIHIMFFVDPATPASLTMATLKKLLVFPGDLILLLHPGIFAEMYKKA